MTSPPDPGSLRERKRLATMAAIEDAATALVLEHGYDAVTVDQICASAEISKRTFFNYVASKDAAVIGSAPADFSAEASESFLNDDEPDVPRAILRLYTGAYAAVRTADNAQMITLAQRRRKIFRAEPELAILRISATSRLQMRLVDLVTEHLERRPELRRLPGVSAEAEARACVTLVAASGQLGLSIWLDRESGTFTDLDDDYDAALDMLANLVTTSTGSPA